MTPPAIVTHPKKSHCYEPKDWKNTQKTKGYQYNNKNNSIYIPEDFDNIFLTFYKIGELIYELVYTISFWVMTSVIFPQGKNMTANQLSRESLGHVHTKNHAGMQFWSHVGATVQ